PDAIARLADATARSVPYLGPLAYKRVFNRSLPDLWRDYEAEAVASASRPALDAGISRVTQSGFLAIAPRFDRFAPGEIVVTLQTPDKFPGLYRVRLDGLTSRRVVTRYAGSGTGLGRDAMYIDQLEYARSTSLYSDLYEVSRASGHLRRLTFGARLVEPDLSPDGTTLACVRAGPGHRDLVVVPVGRPDDVQVLVSDDESQFNGPRWSPDGRQIVAERHRLRADPDLVVYDRASRALRVVASWPGTRIVTPTWRPDGRAIVAA